MKYERSTEPGHVTVPVSLLCDVDDWFSRNDGKADDFGRLFFVADIEDILDRIDPDIRSRMSEKRRQPESDYKQSWLRRWLLS